MKNPMIPPLLFILLLMVSIVSAETWHVTSLSQCAVNSKNESCLTMSQIVTNIGKYITDNTTLVLLPGDHTLDSKLVIRNILSFEISALSNATINCSKSGRLSIANVSMVQFKDIVFTGCVGNDVKQTDHFIVKNCHFNGSRDTNIYYPVNGIHLQQVSLADITSSSFSSHRTSGRGGALSCNACTLNITNCIFRNNRAKRGEGTIHANGSSNVMIDSSVFAYNRARYGGALSVQLNASDTVSINNSIFIDNRAYRGGAISATGRNIIKKGQSVLSTTIAHCNGGAAVTIDNSLFAYNRAYYNGGVVHINRNSIMTCNTVFHSNIAGNDGGAMNVHFSLVASINTSFINNEAHRYGEVLHIESSSFTSGEFLKFQHNQGGIGVVYAVKSEFLMSGTSAISNNCGSFLVIGCNVVFRGDINFSNNRENACTNQTLRGTQLQQGGAVTAFNSNVWLGTNATLVGNQAENGGGILSFESKLYINGDITISNNSAQLSGGGIYAYQSELSFMGANTITDNTADNEGGGIHAISSITRLLEGTLHFARNHASRGGGVFLEYNSKLHIIKSDDERGLLNVDSWLSLDFINNSADYGGAIYVSDNTNSGICASVPSNVLSSATSECFFQTLVFYRVPLKRAHRFKYPNSHYRMNLNALNTHFANNSAAVAGDSLYGGMLDRCAVNPQAEIFLKYPNVSLSALDHIYNVTSIKPQSITSDPVRVCFCKQNQPDCSYQPDPRKVTKGERFVLTVVAVDQVGRPTPSIIHSSLQSQGGTFSEGQLLQTTSGTCTELEYNILSPHDSEQLLLYAEGPCKDIGMSRRSINVTFLPCDCPIGFERSNVTQTNCSCICDSPIRSFISECSFKTESIVRKGDFWITYENSSISNSTGYIIYETCPFDYCYPPTTPVSINLNIPNGSNAQCAFSRSGLLCGSCQEGLSLCLGSSRCMQCSNYWLALIIPFAIAGIVLVAFLLVCNSTVAVGTMNGLTFYANIVITVCSTFFPFHTPTFLTIFISWVNLDLGIETCFYDGMDGYATTWLQLVFPLYLIFLVVMIIIIAEHSQRFSKLISKRNPVATLATLILLSYSKFLRTIITILQSTTLKYHGRVWLLDATIPYLQGKHIALFITGIIILIVGLLYTAVLLLSQWIIRCPSRKCLQYFINSKMNSFLETYFAPYNPKHHYWTGFLLLVRIILYLISAVVSTPNVSLLAIITVVILVIMVKQVSSRIYRKWSFDILESSFLLNLILFAAATLYLYDSPNRVKYQQMLANTSLSIAFITFILIVLYHFYKYEIVTSSIWKTKTKQLRAWYSNTTVAKKFHTKFERNKNSKDHHTLHNGKPRVLNDNDYLKPPLNLIQHAPTANEYRLAELPSPPQVVTQTVIELRRTDIPLSVQLGHTDTSDFSDNNTPDSSVHSVTLGSPTKLLDTYTM